MEMLKAAALSACFLGIIFSVSEGINPSEKLSKQLRVIFSLILIMVTVPKFINSDLDLSELDPTGEKLKDYTEITQMLIDDRINENICDSLRSILNENGIEPVKISVVINNSSDGSISITEAQIELVSEKDRAAAQRIVSQAVGEGADVKIIVGGE